MTLQLIYSLDLLTLCSDDSRTILLEHELVKQRCCTWIDASFQEEKPVFSCKWLQKREKWIAEIFIYFYDQQLGTESVINLTLKCSTIVI